MNFLLPLVGVTCLYFAIAMIKPFIQPRLPFNVCAICTAVSLTWIVLLINRFVSGSGPPETIAILMGMSTAGLMYNLEKTFKKYEIKNFWFVRLVIIIGGFCCIFFILHNRWPFLILTLVASMLAAALATFFFQGITHADVVKEQKLRGFKASLIKKLDECC